MMIIITIAYILFLVSQIGYFKAKADSVAHKSDSINENWYKKWARSKENYCPINNIEKKQKWYYFGTKYHHWWYLGFFKPKYIERFPYSSTILVFLTDRWHWYNFWQYRFTHLAIVYSIPIDIWYKVLLLFVFPLVQGLVFELNYKK